MRSAAGYRRYLRPMETAAVASHLRAQVIELARTDSRVAARSIRTIAGTVARPEDIA